MKPAQIIQEEKKKFEKIISEASEKFSEETGGAITDIHVYFINTTTLSDEYTKTIIRKIDVSYLL